MGSAGSPQTETLHEKARGLDARPGQEILSVLLQGQSAALEAVAAALPQIGEAAGLMARTLGAGGRLHYAAAGSSALMALADAAELPGTYGIAADQIAVHMAGGIPAGGVMPGHTEDDASAADAAAQAVRPGDLVIALSASGTTPYPIAFAARAKTAGARVAAIANNAGTPLLEMADAAVCIATPPEVVAGSTRMGAGTAQKAALNMISTLAGIRLGHVMDGMMVNLVADNDKLRARAAGIVAQIAGCPLDAARESLARASGAVKPAVLLAAGAGSLQQAEAMLAAENANLRAALARL